LSALQNGNTVEVLSAKTGRRKDKKDGSRAQRDAAAIGRFNAQLFWGEKVRSRSGVSTCSWGEKEGEGMRKRREEERRSGGSRGHHWGLLPVGGLLLYDPILSRGGETKDPCD